MSSTLPNTAGDYASTGQDPSAAGGSPFGTLLPRIARIPARRWQFTLGCLLLSGAIAFLAGTQFSQKSHRTEGTLLYSPLDVQENLKHLYSTPPLPTLFELTKSRNNYEALCKEFKLTIPADVLSKLYQITPPPADSHLMVVSLDWADGEQGAEMVNRFMAIHVEQVANLRRKKFDTLITTHEGLVDRSSRDVEQAKKAWEAFLKKEDLSDPKTEQDRLAKDVAALETNLAAAEGQKVSTDLQIKEFEKYIQKLEKEGPGATPGEVDEAFLQRQAETKRRLTEEEAKVKVADLELKRKTDRLEKVVKPLVKDRIMLPSEQQSLESEISILNIQIQTSKKAIESLNEELKRNKPGSAAIQRALAKMGDLTLQRVGIEGTAAQIKQNLEAARKQKRRMDEIVRESEPLALEVKRTEAERQKHESQLQALRTLREIDSEEVKIESRAIVVPSGVSSNRKKLTLIVFALSMVVCLGLMTGYEMSTSVWRAETLAGRLHLPVLVRSAPSKDERSGGLTQDQARALSLRIRQHVPDAGGVVLLTSLNEGKEVDNLAGNLSRYFSMRDEKVLILDARIQDSPTDGLSRLVERQGAIEVVPESDTPSRRGGAGLPGLVQYLVFEGQDPARFIRPTRFAAVDYLPSGGPYSMTDVLASEPMKELLDEQRKKYTLVLIAAPALARRVDVEILAAYVNGLVAVIDPPLSSGTPAIEEFMQSLKDAGVPLLGAVISV